MSALRQVKILLFMSALSAGCAYDQVASDGATEAATPSWSYSAYAYGYVVPGEGDYVQPTVTADRDWLHLEARYNYEALDTGSLWAGYNFDGGQEVAWSLTPMLGGVFGDTRGIAPGYRGSVGWWLLEFCSEGEYLFDSGGTSGSFFYNWSELTLAPVDWLWFGLVTQRTQAYRAEHEVQLGPLLGLSWEGLTLTGYAFDLDDSDPVWIVSVGWDH